MLKGYQIRAARALINWSLKDLEDACGLTSQSISNFEVGRSNLTAANLDKVVTAFERGGVEFTSTGVQLSSTPIYYHEGEDWYLSLLEDAYNTVLDSENPSILIENVDDQRSPSHIVQKLKKIRNSGIELKMTTKEGSTYLLAPSSCYRFIPEKFFKNWVVMLFGDKAAFSIEKESRCVVVQDKDMVTSLINRFNLLWEVLPELKIQSTANERI
jgi:transcriptional regulator with XRE-family HTH domain